MEKHRYLGNFEFMISHNKKVYDYLFHCERNARTALTDSCLQLRKALEAFVYSVRDDNGKTAEDVKFYNNGSDATLASTIRYLRFGSVRNKLPSAPMINGTGFSGKDPYLVIRLLGNKGAHTDDMNQHWVPNSCYHNLIVCLTAFQKILKNYYRESAPDFNENYMPIDEFRLISSKKPEDADRSYCQLECVGYSEVSRMYAVLRVYNRKKLSETFMNRNLDSFMEAANSSFDNVPKGMARLRVLSGASGDESNYYILCYGFSGFPQKLSDIKIGELSAEQRLLMCSRLADAVAELHSAENPIYQRLLTHQSIYVNEKRRQFIPYIVKFDYSKIDNPELNTIIADANKAARKADKIIDEYISPEYKNAIESGTNGQVDWEKVDIFSMGVLFIKIMLGDFSVTAELNLRKLTDRQLQGLLDEMLSDEPEERPTAEEVADSLRRSIQK